jgi:DNA-binding NtrC family response regulator
MPDEPPIRILIVDSQPSICRLCATVGHEMGLVCLQAASAEEALERVDQDVPELVLADLAGKMTGLELLAAVKSRSPLTEVALMSACGTVESAVEAMRLGAYDFVLKPLRVEKLKLTLTRMVEKVRLVRENEVLRSRSQIKPPVVAEPCTDLEELERLTVQRVFQQVNGDKEQAQKLLGISRATLYRKIKRYGIKTQPARQNVEEPRSRRAVEQVVVLSQS